MSYFVNRIRSFALFSVLAVAATATASAQQARFHLPFDAKWGGMVLPAGDYEIQLSKISLGGSGDIFVRGPVTGFVSPMVRDAYGERHAPADNDYLQLVKVGDVFYVEKYEESSMLTTFYFKAPKQPRPENTASRQIVNIKVKGS